jgi:hypothetical protein
MRALEAAGALAGPRRSPCRRRRGTLGARRDLMFPNGIICSPGGIGAAMEPFDGRLTGQAAAEDGSEQRLQLVAVLVEPFLQGPQPWVETPGEIEIARADERVRGLGVELKHVADLFGEG